MCLTFRDGSLLEELLRLGGGGGTLGLLTWFGQRNRRIGCPQLGFDTCDIGIEQTALVGTLLLAAFGELASLEDGDREQVAR